MEHQAGSHWVGKKFDGYFEKGKPYLEGYRAVFMSGAPMVNALSAGQVMVEFRGHSPADKDRLVQALGDRAVVVESPWVCSLVVSFNVKKKPFDDPRVRRAVAGDRSLGRRTGTAENRAGATRRRVAAPWL